MTSKRLPSAPQLAQLINSLNIMYISLIDAYAPLKSRLVTWKPDAPWYTEPNREAKHTHRRLENIWRESKLKFDHIANRKQYSIVAR